ncbi:hypothetical protein [Anaerocellum diazotrophicum]|nr:hypothetical protein [Caldicellulosiruptor diazotrophicus]
MLPLYYKLDNDFSGYPGFLTEAANNIYKILNSKKIKIWRTAT